jgi:hypothetical protein
MLLLLMAVNEEYGVEVDCSNIKLMLSFAKIGRVVQKLKVEVAQTHIQGAFLICMAHFTLLSFLTGNLDLQLRI